MYKSGFPRFAAEVGGGVYRPSILTPWQRKVKTATAISSSAYRRSGACRFSTFLSTLLEGSSWRSFSAAGMGISQLLTSSTNTIQQLSSLGLNLSIVKETASRKDDSESLPHAMATARRLILLTSALGAALCLILSPLLSLWTFGDYSYTLSFVALSVMVAYGGGKRTSGFASRHGGGETPVEGIACRRTRRTVLRGACSIIFLGQTALSRNDNTGSGHIPFLLYLLS